MVDKQGQLGGLLERVKLGNARLYEAFLNSINASNEAQAEAYRVSIDRAFPRLERLCWELEASGWTKCLYSEPYCIRSGYGVGAGFFCWACPAQVLPRAVEPVVAVGVEPKVAVEAVQSEVDKLWSEIQREPVAVEAVLESLPLRDSKVYQALLSSPTLSHLAEEYATLLREPEVVKI